MSDLKPPPEFASSDFEPTMQLEKLRDTGFGPLEEFGDKPESGFRTWLVIIALCMILAALLKWAWWASVQMFVG